MIQDSRSPDIDVGLGFDPEANWKRLLCAAGAVEGQLGGGASDESRSEKSELRKTGRLVYSGCCPFCDPDVYVSDVSDELVSSRKRKARSLSVELFESCDDKSGVMSGSCASSSGDKKIESFALPLKKRRAATAIVSSQHPIGDVKPRELVLKRRMKKNATKTKTKTKKSSGKSNKSKSSSFQNFDMADEFEEMIKIMGGTDIILVIQKQLYKTDVEKGNCRLSMPFSQLIGREFLRDAERTLLEERDEDGHCKVIEVPMLDPMLGEKVWTITLRKWVMGKVTRVKSEHYVLSKPWSEVAEANNLKVGDMVQVWAFRVADQLCLALVKVDVC